MTVGVFGGLHDSLFLSRHIFYNHATMSECYLPPRMRYYFVIFLLYPAIRDTTLTTQLHQPASRWLLFARAMGLLTTYCDNNFRNWIINLFDQTIVCRTVYEAWQLADICHELDDMTSITTIFRVSQLGKVHFSLLFDKWNQYDHNFISEPANESDKIRTRAILVSSTGTVNTHPQKSSCTPAQHHFQPTPPRSSDVTCFFCPFRTRHWSRVEEMRQLLAAALYTVADRVRLLLSSSGLENSPR